jgi:hypothetical protein
MHFIAVTAATRPSRRNHLTYVKHADQTGKPSAPELGNLRSASWEIRTPGGGKDSALGSLILWNASRAG